MAQVCYHPSVEGAQHAWTSNEFEGEGALRVPVWPARFIIVLGTFLAALNYLLLIIQRIAAPLDSPPAGNVIAEISSLVVSSPPSEPGVS